MKFFIALALFSIPFATFATFQCSKVTIENKSYVYCPHNNSLYEPVNVSEKKLSDIKSKLAKLKQKNAQERANQESKSLIEKHSVIKE